MVPPAGEGVSTDEDFSWRDCDCIPSTVTDHRSLFLCGCGQHHALIPLARVIHWQPPGAASRHWYMQCAFSHALFLVTNA